MNEITRKDIMKRCSAIVIAFILSVVVIPPSILATHPSIKGETIWINEIMFNPEGSDSGREWIEIYNYGTSDINISGWKLWEGGSNHTISLIKGSWIIGKLSYAIIANNATKFLQDHPDYKGTLFESKFSLSNNKNETIVLKNSSLGEVDSATYNHSILEGYSFEKYPENPWMQSKEEGGTPGEVNSYFLEWIDVSKEVWNGEAWSDNAQVENGSTVTFRITVYNKCPCYLKTKYLLWFSGKIIDYLPCNLNYIKGSVHDIILNGSPVNETVKQEMINGEVYNDTTKVIEWNKVPEPINYLRSLSFKFNAIANCTSCEEGINKAVAIAFFASQNLSWRIYVSDNDTAFVACKPTIKVKKLVKNETEDFAKETIAKIGEKVTFLIKVKNEINASLNITVRDKLPVGLIFVNASPSPSDVSGNVIYWNLTGVDRNEERFILLNATVNETGIFRNEVEIWNESFNVSDRDHAHVIAGLIIEVKKEAWNESEEAWSHMVRAKVGSDVMFRITVRNKGTALPYVVVRDLLPPFTSYSSACPEPDFINGREVMWHIKDFDADETRTFLLCAHVEQVGEGPNVAEVLAFERLIGRDKAIVKAVLRPALDIEKEVSIDNVTWSKFAWIDVGDIVYFRINVSNNLPANISNVKVIDKLPSFLKYNYDANIEPTGANDTYIEWWFNKLEAGEYKIITFSATAIDKGYGENVVHASACSRFFGKDRAYVLVQHRPEIRVDKKAWNGTAWVDELYVKEYALNGTAVKFRITVENTGGVTLKNIEVQDIMSCGLEWTPGTFSPQPDELTMYSITWRIDSLKPGETIYIYFDGRVHCDSLNKVYAYAESELGSANDVDHLYISRYPIVLAYEPKSHDFGEVEQNKVVKTTFQIWNNGTGLLVYNLTENCTWLSVYPTEGNSTGEKDNITITVDTHGLAEGNYTCNIFINSNGGKGVFTVKLRVIGIPELSISPSSHDFGYVPKGESVSTTFKVWNSRTGTLEYTVSPECDWITVSPASGVSTGEKDTIHVTVYTSGLSPGSHSCDIRIQSNGGNKTFTISLNVFEPQPPIIELIKPVKGRIYVRNKPLLIPIFFTTIIKGPITVHAEVSDPNPGGKIERVEFYVDDELKEGDTAPPYAWVWSGWVFGSHTLKVKAIDNYGIENETELKVLIFSFGFGAPTTGTVYGKVTEAGHLFKKPIAGVTVTAEPKYGEGKRETTTTGSIPLINKGKYKLHLEEGTYEITFQHPDYKTYTKEIEVIPGEEIKLNVSLESK